MFQKPTFPWQVTEITVHVLGLFFRFSVVEFFYSRFGCDACCPLMVNELKHIMDT